MFFYASKILVWLIYPLSLGILFLAAAFLLRNMKKRRVFNTLFMSGILILYLFSIAPVANFLLMPLERKHPLVDYNNLKADAIVVLAGDVKRRFFPGDQVELAGNRVLKGVRLFRQGAAPLIIMTGGSGDIFDQEFQEAPLMKEFAVEFGVPPDRIIVEAGSRNTHENALHTKKLLDTLEGRNIILVTSAFHMPRAYSVFRKRGIETFPASTDFVVRQGHYTPFSFIPQTGYLNRSSTAIKEYAGIFMYWLRGWI